MADEERHVALYDELEEEEAQLQELEREQQRLDDEEAAAKAAAAGESEAADDAAEPPAEQAPAAPAATAEASGQNLKPATPVFEDVVLTPDASSVPSSISTSPMRVEPVQVQSPRSVSPADTGSAASDGSVTSPTAAAAPGDIVILGKGDGDPSRQSNASSLRQMAENTFRIAKQKVQERFKKDKAGLITTDPELESHLERFEMSKENFAQLKKTLGGYKKNLAALQESEEEFHKYLQEQGIKTPTTVGNMMTALAGSLRGVHKSREAMLIPAVEMVSAEVDTFADRVLQDAQQFLKKLEKARVTFDAQRSTVKTLEVDKERKPEKFEEAVASCTTAETEYKSTREASITKLQLVNDHRLQVLGKTLEKYNEHMLKHLNEGTEQLKEAVGVHEAVVADDCADKQILN